MKTTEHMPESAPDASAPTAPIVRPPLRELGSRLLYWVPVFAALVLFAQIAFLGLRPAMREASRLASASDMLQARWSHDRSLYDAYEMQLAVRRDPIFRERQSRLRRGARPLTESEGTVGAEGASGGLDRTLSPREAGTSPREAGISNPTSRAAGTSGF